MTVRRSEEELSVRPLRFTLRIGHFSGVVSRGGSCISHVFQSSVSSSGWSLVANVDGSDATVFRLHRRVHNGGGEWQSVGVRLTIVDCLGSRLLSTKRQLHFQGSEGESQPVMRLKADQIAGWRGLKSLCFLPNDTLTLRCEIYESGESFLDEKVPLPCGRAGWRDSYLLSVPATGMPLA